MAREIYIPGANRRSRPHRPFEAGAQAKTVNEVLRSSMGAGIQLTRERMGKTGRGQTVFGKEFGVPLEPVRDAKPTVVHDTTLDSSKLTKNGDIPTKITVSDV